MIKIFELILKKYVDWMWALHLFVAKVIFSISLFLVPMAVIMSIIMLILNLF